MKINHELQLILKRVLVLLLLCLSSCSNGRENGDTSGIFENSLVDELSSSFWVLQDARDSQGNMVLSEDEIVSFNYLLMLSDDGIFRMTIFCEIINGFYTLNESVMEIDRRTPSNPIECVSTPAMELSPINDFLRNFFESRELIVGLSGDTLVLSGIDNDFTRYERCLVC